MVAFLAAAGFAAARDCRASRSGGRGGGGVRVRRRARRADARKRARARLRQTGRRATHRAVVRGVGRAARGALRGGLRLQARRRGGECVGEKSARQADARKRALVSAQRLTRPLTMRVIEALLTRRLPFCGRARMSAGTCAMGARATIVGRRDREREREGPQVRRGPAQGAGGPRARAARGGWTRGSARPHASERERRHANKHRHSRAPKASASVPPSSTASPS